MRLAVVLLALLPGAAFARINEVSVYLGGGQTVSTWHGQAHFQSLNLELGHALSPRNEIAFVVAPMNFWQPRSWFGDDYGDGNQNVRAISGSLLLRRWFRTSSTRLHVYGEASTGPMWSEKQVPAATSQFNFLTQAGAGAILMPQSRTPLLIGIRYLHVSNGGFSSRNPGLNASALVIGVRFSGRR